MTLDELKALLRQCPLVASVQAPDNSPLDSADAIVRLARASLSRGVKLLRIEGIAKINVVKEALSVPTIGLIKHHLEGSDVYITPSLRDIDRLLETGCEIIAMDATLRSRPDRLDEMVAKVHVAGRLALADCDSEDSIKNAVAIGFDIISTTLAGYTDSNRPRIHPDIDLIRIANQFDPPLLFAEGRFAEPCQFQTALLAGADGVVIGGALNDPLKQTERFLSSAPRRIRVGAIDIGGTFIRFAPFSDRWIRGGVTQVPLQSSRKERLEWMKDQIADSGVSFVGISCGGTIDPNTGEVWESKGSIPENLGTVFSEETLGVPCLALNDGLASSWGHACLPEFAGKRVATVALGTGIGFGLADNGKLQMGPRGEYPRLNDVSAFGEATLEQRYRNRDLAPQDVFSLVQNLLLPDHIVVCGGGMSDYESPPNVLASPFGSYAGLYGAAALALFTPCNFSR